MKRRNITCICAIALGLSVSAIAQGPATQPQQPAGQNGPHRRPPPHPLLQALDTNHDGALSADEIANAPASLLTLDKNRDGQLTPDELMPPPPPRPDGNQQGPPPGPGGQQRQPPGPGQGGAQRQQPSQMGNNHRHHPPSPIMQALDTNHDGTLSADEIATAAASLKTLDKNHDGQLTPDELRPPMPPPPDGTSQRSPGADGQRRQQPPASPVMSALDLNHDGTLSAYEIANASNALWTLDKNHDGQLTPDEICPPEPPETANQDMGPPNGPGPENGPGQMQQANLDPGY